MNIFFSHHNSNINTGNATGIYVRVILFLLLILFFSTDLIMAQSFNTTSFKPTLNYVSISPPINASTSSNMLHRVDTIFVIQNNKNISNDLINDIDGSEDEIIINDSEYTNLSYDFSLPLDNIYITSNFGVRKHPISGKIKHHNGVDFRANMDNVKSVLNGIIVGSGWTNSNGNYLAVKTNNYILYYLHLEEYYYKNNDVVKAGDVIGLSGSTGSSTAPHLHFAVKRNSKWINPIQFLTDLDNLHKDFTNNF